MFAFRSSRAVNVAPVHRRTAVRYISSITSQLEQLVNGVENEELSRQEQRKALTLARKLCWQLEKPMDAIFRVSWMEPEYNASLKVCMNLNVFDILGQHSPDFVSAATIVDEIKKSQPEVKLDAGLLSRFLRHLAAMGAVREREPGEYAATPLTEALRNPHITGGVDFWFDVAGPVFRALPASLKSNDYSNKENDTWKLARDTDLTFFGWLKSHPKEMASFANHMAGYASDRGLWTDMYPVKERLLEGADADLPLVVDVGGGKGHDMLRLAEKYNIEPSRLYVQDLDVVIAPAKASDRTGLNLMAHDFFTEQPLKHARAYYTHSVPHNWSDENFLKIIGHIKEAMKPGYSKLLINEIMIPATGCDPVSSGLDLVMMGNFGGDVRERTKAEWEQLLATAGLKITGIWHEPESVREAIIEAELV